MSSLFLRISACLGSAALAFGQNPIPAEINAAFNVNASQTTEVELNGDLGQSIVATLAIDGRKDRLLLNPHSVRADNFQLLEQLEDGSYVAVDPGPVSTYRGTIEGLPGSVVVGGMQDSGLFAKLILTDGRTLWLEPLARQFPSASDYVLYDAQDVQAHGRPCGTSGMPHINPAPADGGTTLPLGTLLVAELGCDADFEFYQDYGSSTTNTSNRVQNVIGTMNNQYESQTNITHLITTVIVRTTNNDPYSSTDAGTLLNQFRNHWNSSQGGVQRDVAQLFTGKSIDGGTIGIAWLSAVCTSFGYGLVESDFNNNFNCATDLSAHELGHNWAGDHCSCTSFTMNPFITCANSFNNFSINQITSFANSLNCLDTGGGGCVDDTFENNDVCSNPTPLGTGLSSGYKAKDADRDFFEIAVGPFGTVTVDVLFNHSDADVDVNLFDAFCGTTLDSGTSGSNNETVTYTNPGNSNITVKLDVYVFGGSGCADYALDVDVQAGDPCQGPDDSFEPNDSCGQAAPVTNFSFDAGYVEKTDPDFYELCVSPGDTLTVDAFFSHADGDIDLYLYDAASCGGSALDSSLSTTNNEDISWTNNTGSGLTVILEVQVWQNSSSDCNNYIISSTGGGGDCTGTGPGPIGNNYCTSNPNSTGQGGVISGFGSDVAADDNVQLTASQLPNNQSGYFLASPNQTFIPNPGGSQGDLCIGSPTARFVSQVASSGNNGEIQIQVDTTDIPTNPSQPILAGQTWHFQLWYRDLNPNQTSNFTNGLIIQFQ